MQIDRELRAVQFVPSPSPPHPPFLIFPPALRARFRLWPSATGTFSRCARVRSAGLRPENRKWLRHFLKLHASRGAKFLKIVFKWVRMNAFWTFIFTEICYTTSFSLSPTFPKNWIFCDPFTKLNLSPSLDRANLNAYNPWEIVSRLQTIQRIFNLIQNLQLVFLRDQLTVFLPSMWRDSLAGIVVWIQLGFRFRGFQPYA